MKKINYSWLIIILFGVIGLMILAGLAALPGVLAAALFLGIGLESNTKAYFSINTVIVFFLTLLAVEIGSLLAAAIAVQDTGMSFSVFAWVGCIASGLTYTLSWFLAKLIKFKKPTLETRKK